MPSARAEIRAKVTKQRTLNALDRIISAIDELTPMAVEEARDQTRRDVVRLLRLRMHPPGTPTPSPPGEPPARITGALLRSVNAEPVVRTGAWTWSARVGTRIIYGRIQELGGMSGRGHRTYLPPRPYLSRAVTDLHAVGFYRDTFTTYWAEAMHG
jgi:phage gpG-like protein